MLLAKFLILRLEKMNDTLFFAGFDRSFAEFFEKRLQFQAGFASAYAGSFVTFFNYGVCIGFKCFPFFFNFLN